MVIQQILIVFWEMFKAVVSFIWAMIPSIVELNKILDLFSAKNIIAMWIGVPSVLVGIILTLVRRLLKNKQVCRVNGIIMVFLDKFVLPIDLEAELIRKRMDQNGGIFGYIDNAYPCGLFSKKNLRELDFEPLTILYGGNGSGKSTLLNLIAQKLKLNRIAPFNSSELYNMYAAKCRYRLGYDDEGFLLKIPSHSRIITSDDVFDYMLTVRANNSEIAEEIEHVRDVDYGKLKFGETIKFNGMQDYEMFRLQVLSRQKSLSRRKFIRKVVGQEVKLISNGETALKYFEGKIQNNSLYCLDEPENSLSPKLQLELVKILKDAVRFCGCQLIIATHSPFILSIEGAKIYDLDDALVTIKKWWELENTRIYYNFFKDRKDLFENHEK